jgi:hypothetical protein
MTTSGGVKTAGKGIGGANLGHIKVLIVGVDPKKQSLGRGATHVYVGGL